LKNNRFKRLIKLNTLLTTALIVCDVFILHPHNTEDTETVRQITVSHSMKHKSITQLKSIQADEEQEFSAK